MSNKKNITFSKQRHSLRMLKKDKFSIEMAIDFRTDLNL